MSREPPRNGSRLTNDAPALDRHQASPRPSTVRRSKCASQFLTSAEPSGWWLREQVPRVNSCRWKQLPEPHICVTHDQVQHNLTALERAFELASSGRCESVAAIRTVLKSEGYSDQQVTGRSLGKQLTDLIRQARLRDRP